LSFYNTFNESLLWLFNVGAVLEAFLRRWRKICTILQPMGSKQGPTPGEIFQTLLTNKKQGNLDYVQASKNSH
jgi:hypothetical protein